MDNDRAMFSGVLDPELLGIQTLEHVLRLSRTWDSTVSLLPKGGETIWGNLDRFPEEGQVCVLSKSRSLKTSKSNSSSDVEGGLQVKESIKYGRIVSFGKSASQLPSTEIPSFDTKVLFY